MAGKFGKAAYTAVVMASLGYGAFGLFDLQFDFWRKLVSLPLKQMALIAFGSMLLVPLLDGIDERLRRLRHPVLEWSIFRRNVNFVPMDYVFLRIPFLVLLYFNLPGLAWVEEMIFRHDWVMHATSGWFDACWRSFLFGVLHVAAGAKLRAVLPLTLGGMWFSWHYLQAGVEAATLAHLSMNVCGLTLMLVAWARTGENPFAQ